MQAPLLKPSQPAGRRRRVSYVHVNMSEHKGKLPNRSKKPCRFYQAQSSCKAGAKCPYLHAKPGQTRDVRDKPAPYHRIVPVAVAPSEPILLTADFKRPSQIRFEPITNILELPDEIVEVLILYVDYISLAAFDSVCSLFRSLAQVWWHPSTMILFQ